MIMRVAFFILCMYILPSQSIAQEFLETAGDEVYWDPTEEELFRIFRKKFWIKKRILHELAIREHTLLVRLDDDHKRIAVLQEKGLTKAIERLKKKNIKRNKEVVKAFQNYCGNDDYYFYYAKDADRLFKNQDFSCLWKDTDTKVADFEVGDKKAMYVLIYRNPIRSVENKEYVLHLWDFSSVKRIRYWNFKSYTNLFSYKLDIDKTVGDFCYKIWNYR